MADELKPYQVDAIREALEALQKHRSAVLVLATGLGKTVIFCAIAKRFVPDRKVLILAHREELIDQAERQVRKWIGGEAGIDVGIEMGDRTSAGVIGRPPVVIASVQTLSRPARLAAYERDAFGLIVVDECHHALGSSYRAILDHFGTAKVLGVTATPTRHDRQALGQVFESAPYSFGLEDGIRGGWLTPVRQMRVVVDSLDFSKVRTTAGDLNEEDLERILTEEQHLHAVAAPALEHMGSRKTLVFATTRRHAHDLAAVFNRLRLGSAKAIDGTASKAVRQSTLQDFRDGKVQFLINCNLYLEGFDEPSISGEVMARPTKSPGLYSQMLGRVTRLYPGKADALVLDFVGNSGRHKLVTALDILGGELEPRVRDAAQAAADQGVPLLDAVAQARAKIEEEDARLRESAIAEEQRRGIVGKVQSHLVEVVSGFGLFEFDPATARRNGADMSERQLNALRNFGFAEPEVADLDRAQAAALLDKAIARARGELCTRKQARFLAKFGVDARAMSFRGASKLIDAIKKNGWKAPKLPPGSPPPAPRPPHTAAPTPALKPPRPSGPPPAAAAAAASETQGLSQAQSRNLSRAQPRGAPHELV